MEWDQDIHYLLGQLSMADEMIAECEKYRTSGARRKLKEMKTARAEVVKKLNKLAGESVVISLRKGQAP